MDGSRWRALKVDWPTCRRYLALLHAAARVLGPKATRRGGAFARKRQEHCSAEAKRTHQFGTRWEAVARFRVRVNWAWLLGWNLRLRLDGGLGETIRWYQISQRTILVDCHD